MANSFEKPSSGWDSTELPENDEGAPREGNDKSTAPSAPKLLEDDPFILKPTDGEETESYGQVIELSDEDFDDFDATLSAVPGADGPEAKGEVMGMGFDKDVPIQEMGGFGEDSHTERAKREPQLETYSSARERKTPANAAELDARAQALDGILRRGEGYPPDMFDLEDAKGWQRDRSVKKIIPENYFDDPRAAAEVEKVLSDIDRQRPLMEILNEARTAAQQGDLKKLVAVKLVGARLLQDVDKFGPAKSRRWEDLSEDMRREVRLGEMLTLHTEASMAEINAKKAISEWPQEQRRQHAKRFAAYARNDDLPPVFRKYLQTVSRKLSRERAVRPSKSAAEQVLTEQRRGDAESVLTETPTQSSVDTNVGRADRTVFEVIPDDTEAVEPEMVEGETELDPSPVIPIPEAELQADIEAQQIAPVKSPEEFMAQEREIDAMLPPRFEQPAVVSPKPSHGDLLIEREAALVGRLRRYESSSNPDAHAAVMVLEGGDLDGRGLDLEHFAPRLTGLALQETLQDQTKEARRQRYLDPQVLLNEVGYGRIKREGGFLNRWISGPAESTLARVRVAGNLGRFLPYNPESLRQVIEARHSVVQSLRRAAARDRRSRTPLENALLTQLADRLELLNIDEARRFQNPFLKRLWRRVTGVLGNR